MRATGLIIACTAATLAAAQGTPPEVALDRDSILIGQQTSLDLSVTYRLGQGQVLEIVWPVIGDTLTGNVEVVADSGVDTVRVRPEQDPDLYSQRRTLTITSFDSGYWAIPPFSFVIAGDTVGTKPLLLAVHTVEVDTAESFRDINDIYELPFSWRYWLKKNWPYVAGAAAFLAALLLVVRELRRRKRAGPPPAVSAPPPPLHLRALAALEDVERKKLWQQGLVKQYHSEVTDILRGYIEERFKVPALERTTDELMLELNLSAMSAGHREQLRNLLQLADMVKFAKWSPSPTENEQLLAGTRQLVHGTSTANEAATTNDAPRS